MKLSRSRTHRVNLGQGTYEYVEFSASAEVEVTNNKDIPSAIVVLNKMLDDLLEEDMQEAVANVPAGEKTHAETWRK
jgi:hypothetical protein